MNKQEAAEYINDLDDNTGIFIAIVQPEDIEQYCDDDFKAAFAKMSDERKAKLLSSLANQCHEVLEQHPDYGFGNLVRTAIDKQTADETADYYDNHCVIY